MCVLWVSFWILFKKLNKVLAAYDYYDYYPYATQVATDSSVTWL